MYVGFNFGGWMTNGTAEVMAKETAATAVAERLGTICVGAVLVRTQYGDPTTGTRRGGVRWATKGRRIKRRLGNRRS